MEKFHLQFRILYNNETRYLNRYFATGLRGFKSKTILQLQKEEEKRRTNSFVNMKIFKQSMHFSKNVVIDMFLVSKER